MHCALADAARDVGYPCVLCNDQTPRLEEKEQKEKGRVHGDQEFGYSLRPCPHPVPARAPMDDARDPSFRLTLFLRPWGLYKATASSPAERCHRVRLWPRRPASGLPPVRWAHQPGK